MGGGVRFGECRRVEGVLVYFKFDVDGSRVFSFVSNIILLNNIAGGHMQQTFPESWT